MSVADRLREKFDGLNAAATKLEDALLDSPPAGKPLIRGRLKAVSNELARVKARIDTIVATTPAPKPEIEADLLAAIAAVGAATATSAGVNGLLAAATRLINAYRV